MGARGKAGNHVPQQRVAQVGCARGWSTVGGQTASGPGRPCKGLQHCGKALTPHCQTAIGSVGPRWVVWSTVGGRQSHVARQPEAQGRQADCFELGSWDHTWLPRVCVCVPLLIGFLCGSLLLPQPRYERKAWALLALCRCERHGSTGCFLRSACGGVRWLGRVLARTCCCGPCPQHSVHFMVFQRVPLPVCRATFQ